MTRAKCPICGKEFTFVNIMDWPSFPFCTDRCKLIDLGRWIDGAYVLPEKPGPKPDPEDSEVEPGSEEDE